MKHRITILDTHETYDCGDDESLLGAMVKIGRKGIPSGCHGGGCGGRRRGARVAHREHLGVSDWRRSLLCSDCHSVPTAVDTPGHLDGDDVAEVPFDSDYKFMATFHNMTNEQGEPVVRCFVKGAPEKGLSFQEGKDGGRV